MSVWVRQSGCLLGVADVYGPAVVRVQVSMGPEAEVGAVEKAETGKSE